MLLLAFLLAPKIKDKEKLAAYECGFSPFSDARLKSQIHFVVTAIFFGIFDIEVLFILPWAYSLGNLNKFGLFSGIFFISILLISFIYELNKKALNWK
jgi:NADH-quinone oxidoreductase subunit A